MREDARVDLSEQDGTLTDPGTEAARAEPLGARTAAALVFGSSAAVLVVELVALRLLAPYLGLTLETNTLVIGVALAQKLEGRLRPSSVVAFADLAEAEGQVASCGATDLLVVHVLSLIHI